MPPAAARVTPAGIRTTKVRVPKPIRAPRRPPRAPVLRAALTTGQIVARSVLIVFAALLLAFVLNVTVLSQIQHLVVQQQLSDSYREQLAAGTAPVSEGDFNNVLLPDGAPLGVISIPSLGINEVFVEGTSADSLKSGPGHRRDTVLPGQAGISVIMGRAAAYGAPFARIQELAPGDQFSVRTGQGKQVFTVVGVRYAGDPTLVSPTSTQSRLTLVTARGPAFIPSGLAYVDAQLVQQAKPAGARQTTYIGLPPQDLAMASDTSTIWALVFALQFLVIAEIASVWAYRRIGAQKTWVVFVPVTLLAVLFTANQVTILLPNLL
ncbi:MAG: sortase [Candidatus Saccharibacteria bacterium]|nr:sortase [Microbacteriaceae bacterium]